jgi:molecular chaperone DnaK (HSP70)
MSMMDCVGIDLGTTCSVVAVWTNEGVKVLEVRSLEFS